MLNYLNTLLAAIIIFSTGFSGCSYHNIKPVGQKIAVDNSGNAIYQVSASNIEIAYKLVGKGKPLLLIMGLGWSMEQWPPELLSELSQLYQLIIPDNRGIGYSSIDSTKFSYDLFANDFIALLSVLKIEKINVLGYSMGATITQKLFLDYPESINKAILLATTIDGSQLPEDIKDKMPDKAVIHKQIAVSKNWKTPIEKLQFIQNDILIVIGSKDFIVGTESSEILTQNLSNAKLEIFNDASHLLMYEQTEKLANSIKSFLE